nr:MAG: hypothetical protein DIU70_08965 [Bacillota bacterium]
MIVLYARVSTEDQARSGYSLPEQLRACRARAAELAPGTPVVEFTDDLSGEILERPGLQAALDLVRQGQVQYFICLHPDRLARNLVHQLLIYDEIRRAGAEIVFVQAAIEDTPEGRLFLSMTGAIAEYEKAKIIERTRRGMIGKVRAGGVPHIIRLYGYKFVKGAKHRPANEVVVPDETESRWVLSMFRWCAEEGLGPQAIAERLTQLGVPTKRGKEAWHHTTVRRILRNPVYATGRLVLGKRDHRGIAVARRLPKEERLKRGIKLTARPKPAGQEWGTIQVQPIVPMDLWQRAQEVLAGFRIGGRAENDPRRRYMLTGLGRCGICRGRLMYLSGRQIVCASRYMRHWVAGAPPSDCTLPAKPREAVEAAVWEQVRSWFQEGLLREALEQELAAMAAAPDQTGMEQELEALEEQIQAKREEQERIGLLFARGLWPADTALPALERIANELKALESRSKELRRRLAEGPPVLEQSPLWHLLNDREWLEQVRATLDHLDYAGRTELVQMIVGRYVMYPTGRKQPPKVEVFPRLQ